MITSHATSTPRMRRTRSSINPSDNKSREPSSRFSASVANVVPITAEVPGISRGVIVNCCPVFSETGRRFFSRPVRIFGPCRSARMQMFLPSSAVTLRINWISFTLSGWVPCEKFNRATSMPARSRPRNTVSVLLAGPIVATIFARRELAGELAEVSEVCIHAP